VEVLFVRPGSWRGFSKGVKRAVERCTAVRAGCECGGVSVSVCVWGGERGGRI
jgi:hypothetical protein